MIPKEEVYTKKGQFGTPFTLREAKMMVEKHTMDEYHKRIMTWLIYEVERLREQVEQEGWNPITL